MPDLIIPTPGLKPERMINDYARVEEPILLECGPVKFPDGTSLDIFQADKFEFYIYKQESVHTIKTWNKKTARWELEPGIREEDKEINYLIFDQQDADIPWKGDIFALGRRYQKTDESTGFPQYYIKCFFQATDSSGNVITGISSPSNKLKLSGLGDDYKVGFKIDPPHSLENASGISMFVKDFSRRIIGEVKLTRVDQIGEIEIVNYDNTNTPLASITLDKNGNINIESNNEINITALSVNITGDLKINGGVPWDS